jgi:thiol:disulfide interchange protein
MPPNSTPTTEPIRLSRRHFVLAVCVLLGPGGIGAAELSLPQKFDPARDAGRDLEAALQLARATRRNLLIEIGGEWCTWCRIMDRFFDADADLKQVRDASFVWLKVNFSRENKNDALLSRWPKVAGYPHLFVLNGDGRILQSQDTSVLETGKTYDAKKFRAFLAEWSPR